MWDGVFGEGQIAREKEEGGSGGVRDSYAVDERVAQNGWGE